MSEAAVSDTLHSPVKGKRSMVFVLDKHKQPLMPCTPKKARLLLSRGRAVVHRRYPFVIRLKDRRVEESVMQPLVLKIDPGARTSGMAVVRVEAPPQGQVHHAVHLAEVRHRGEEVHAAMGTRARARRRRRSAHLRYRPPRFANRRRPKGWLPPSLRSRIGNLLSWARRYGRWTPIARLEVERVKFDLHLMQNPEIAGVEYQRGELAGWELRAYLLEKFQHQCAYCHVRDVPFELDHQVPRSRGGSNRASNVVLSCHNCNMAKGNQTAAEFGHPEVEAQAKTPLKDAAAVNAMRYALVRSPGCMPAPGAHCRSLPAGVGSIAGRSLADTAFREPLSCGRNRCTGCKQGIWCWRWFPHRTKPGGGTKDESRSGKAGSFVSMGSTPSQHAAVRCSSVATATNMRSFRQSGLVPSPRNKERLLPPRHECQGIRRRRFDEKNHGLPPGTKTDGRPWFFFLNSPGYVVVSAA